MSGMPSKVYHFLVLQRNQIFCLLFCSIFTLHMPNCVIVVRAIPLFFVATNCSFCTLGNQILNMWTAIIFPLLHVSIL